MKSEPFPPPLNPPSKHMNLLVANLIFTRTFLLQNFEKNYTYEIMKKKNKILSYYILYDTINNLLRFVQYCNYFTPRRLQPATQYF